MRLEIDVNARQFRKRFRRLKNKSFAFGTKAATDRTANVFKQAFIREWRRKLDERRRAFAKNALGIIPAKVNPNLGITTRSTKVLSRPWADEILDTQIRGNPNRRPESGGNWGVPEESLRSIPKTRTFRAGKYIFKALKRKDKYVGVVESTINVPGRVSLQRPLQAARKALPKLMAKSLTRELRRQERKR